MMDEEAAVTKVDLAAAATLVFATIATTVSAVKATAAVRFVEEIEESEAIVTTALIAAVNIESLSSLPCDVSWLIAFREVTAAEITLA